MFRKIFLSVSSGYFFPTALDCSHRAEPPPAFCLCFSQRKLSQNKEKGGDGMGLLCWGSAVDQHPHCCEYLGTVTLTFGMVGAHAITLQDTNMSKCLYLRENPGISVLLYFWGVQQYHGGRRMTNDNRDCPSGHLQPRDKST